jgi:putrescine transport system substrate-binding protein
MSRPNLRPGPLLLAGILAMFLAGCARTSPNGDGAGQGAPSLTDREKVLNVYNWSDYISPDVIPAFEKEYGVKVNYDVFDSNELLETKLLSGSVGYDIVVPSASSLAREIKAGVFRPLDKSQLPNLVNLDPDLLAKMEPFDPGLKYSVNYFWGTSGVGYNVDKIAAAMPDAPVDSFRMFYDPEVVKHFKDCGVTIIDIPDEVLNTVLTYLGREPNSESEEDLAAAEKVLHSIRPYVRYVNASRYIEDLANGEVCLSLGWSGDVGQAAARAEEAANGVHIRYNIPREGAVVFFDMMAIPKDAAHPKNAHLFMNYLLRPDVAAKNSSVVHYATSNAAAYALIDPTVYNDRGVYPGPESRGHLSPNLPHSAAFMRQLTRMWTRFKTGR